MTAYRHACIVAYIGALLVTLSLLIFGAIGLIPINHDYVWIFGGSFLTELLTPIIVTFRSPDFWKDDPNSVANLKRLHSEEITRINQAHVAEKAKAAEGYEAQIAQLKKEKLQLAAQIPRKPPQQLLPGGG